jgi:transcriptional regulator with XRE-family HTH domain
MSISQLYHDGDSKGSVFFDTKVNLECDSLAVMQEESMSDRLRRLRSAKKLTQAGLAAAADVSTSAIGNIEAGLRGYGGSVTAIAAALGTSPEYLQMKPRATESNQGANAPGVSGLSVDAVTIGRIFDWLQDPAAREEVTIITTQAVLARMAHSPRSDVGETEPDSRPTDKQDPTVRGGKRHA